MRVIDYNGTGAWSGDGIIARYAGHARRFHIATPRDLTPREFRQAETTWVYPVMDRVIEGILAGDIACAEVGIDFIEQDASFPFGRILKSNTARALRKSEMLLPEQQERIRRRVASMLSSEYLPREFRQYAKLARKLGMADVLSAHQETLNLANPWVAHYFEYFTR
ncbi:MAG TPA: hypothetical protein VN380_22430 [Thermoanaerobaculia bacterium]|jgi:hypothetical protein|nr:hypothetical protein [Thermoanaerobaculia bacterium]